MTDGCVNEMKRQIQAEVDASMIYLAMGAHFSKDTVNRPGFAQFFFHSAGEEREHGTKLIEYLLMRGQLTGANNEVTNLIKIDVGFLGGRHVQGTIFIICLCVNSLQPKPYGKLLWMH